MSAIKNFYSEEIGDEFDQEEIDEVDLEEMLDEEFESFNDVDLFEAEFPQWMRDSYNYQS